MINEFLVATVCANLAVSSDACNAALHAASRQVGFHRNIEQVENYAKNKIMEETPDLILTAVGYGATIYRLNNGADVKIYFKIPKFCDRVGVGGSLDTPSMSMNWNF